MPFDLTALETRILGCLLEKERTTPENYPLSLNSLTTACNQSTNRDPVTSYDEKTVEDGIFELRQKKLMTMHSMAGSRVPKYAHRLTEHFELKAPEMSLICVLLLRGPQTVGELRQRTERIYGFSSLDQVQQTLDEMANDPTGLVRLLPQRPGQKERRYIQTLSAADTQTEPTFESPSIDGPKGPALPDRVAVLEGQVQALQGELQAIREEFAAFRKQFE